MTRQLIYDLSFEAIEGYLKAINEPKFRAKQIWQGLYKNLWYQSDQFVGIPKKLKERLFLIFPLHPYHPIQN